VKTVVAGAIVASVGGWPTLLLSKERHRDALIRGNSSTKSLGGALVGRVGPRRFRAAKQAEPAGPSQLEQLVDLYLEHLRAGALSARGRPYSARTIAGYTEGLRAFVRLAPECGIADVRAGPQHRCDQGQGRRSRGHTPLSYS
jgi:hypothetical protein